MSRPRRHFFGGVDLHVLNRGVGRRVLFTKDEDFLASERLVEERLQTCRMRLLAYCLMPNHLHFVVWPERDGDLPAFMQQGSRSGNVAVLRQSRSALRRSQLGHRHGRAIGAGMDDSASWKNEETIIRLATATCILRIWWLSRMALGLGLTSYGLMTYVPL